jgi:hypothetical protein
VARRLDGVTGAARMTSARGRPDTKSKRGMADLALGGGGSSGDD